MQRDLNGQMLYTVQIILSPNSPGTAGIGTNVSLCQLRLWLCNAYIKAADNDSSRRILKVNLCHTGNKTVQKSDDDVFRFAHTPIKISFRYRYGSVDSLQDAKAPAVEVSQVIEGNHQSPTVSAANSSSIPPLTLCYVNCD